MNGYYSHKKYKYIKQVSIEEKKINNVLNFKAMGKIWLFKTIIAVAMDFSKSKIFYVIFYGTLTSVLHNKVFCGIYLNFRFIFRGLDKKLCYNSLNSGTEHRYQNPL